MSEPFLILHKVRGEPAFDIAERWSFDGEDGWIVSTSGHRAYPYRQWELYDLADVSDINKEGQHNRPLDMDEIPKDWPDHYPSNDAPYGRGPSSEGSSLAKKLLSKLGLIQPVKADRRD